MYSKALFFSIFHCSVWGTSAFFVQKPSVVGSALRSDANGAFTETGAPPGVQNAGPGMGAMQSAGGPSRPPPMSAFDKLTQVLVQGGSLRTWSFPTASVERVQVLLKTEGRPLNANVDLWQGPDNTPQKMGVYLEDGNVRPFTCVIETPRDQNTVAIRNTGQMEFPLSAFVEAAPGSADLAKALAEAVSPETVQGGALKTYSFAPAVESVQVLLQTDGRPLNSRIELLQGPNNIKQVIELYTEDGMARPFFVVLETPGVGNVVRLLNTSPVEFPMAARVEPYMVDPSADDPSGMVPGGRGFP